MPAEEALTGAHLAIAAAGGTVPDLLLLHHKVFVKELSETHDQRHCRGEVLGVMTETQPFHTDRRSERARVLLGPERLYFAAEWTSIPWSFLKPITVSYWVWVDCPSRSGAENLLQRAQVDDHVEEDPYAEPARYHVWVSELEDVVKLFKLVQPTKEDYESVA